MRWYPERSGDDAVETRGDELVPTLAFPLDIAIAILACAEAPNRSVVALWFLKDDDSISTHNDEKLVTSFYMQSFASFAWDHNLVLS